MRLQEADLRRLCSLAVRAAREAGELIEGRSKSRPEIERKEAGESLASQVVTEVDRLAEALILRVLEPSRREFALGALSEEFGDDGSRFEREAFWCIDPLDGTLPFVEGVPGYSVSIALVSRDGSPLLGVVYDPRGDVVFEAISGRGAKIDGVPFRLSGEGSGSGTLSVFSDRSSRGDAGHVGVLAALEEALGSRSVRNAIGFGAALNACAALRSGYGVYFKLPKEGRGGGSVWDFAAAACIVCEAGGCVSDLFGDPLALNPSGSLFMNERGVLFASDEAIASRIRGTYTKNRDLG